MQQITLNTKRNRLLFTSFVVLIIALSCFIYRLYSDDVRGNLTENLYTSSNAQSLINTSSASLNDISVSKNYTNSSFINQHFNNEFSISNSNQLSSNIKQKEIFIPELNIKMPVIMYHHIRSWEGADTSIEKGLRVSPAVFERHLQYLKENGYNTINTYDLEKYIKADKKLPQKPVLLTFDDGYDDNYIYALPILKKYNMTGDFAIITSAVGRPLYLNWQQIKEMDSSGMSISSHTLNHCILAQKTTNPITMKRDSFQDLLPDEEYKPCSNLNSGERLTKGQVKNELIESKKVIESQVGHSINTIIYPYGGYNTEVVDLAKAAGYSFGFTVSAQKDEDVALNEPFDIPRYRGFGQDDNGELKGFFSGNI